MTTDNSPSQFSHPAWMRAVSAHLSGNETLWDDANCFFTTQNRRWLFAHRHTWNTALSPCPLPGFVNNPQSDQVREILNVISLPLVLRSAPEDHPVMVALLQHAKHVKVLSRWQRAALNVSGSFESWLMENFDHKRRKELKRLKTRLSEQGNLRLETLSSGGDLADHITAFLQLEASGWKGQRGTAIGSNTQLVKALDAGLAAMHALGKLRFWTLWLDDKPIASLFALVSGGQAVLGKIGFDQSFAKYSPGVLLIIDATEALFNDPDVAMADANAIPGHPMIDRIWRDRIACFDVVMAGERVSPLTFQTVAAYHGTKDALRKLLKRIYLRITGRRST